MQPAPTPAMTVRDVAAYLNVVEKTVYRLAKRGDLPGFKVAGTWRFKPSDVDEWIDLQKKATEGPGIEERSPEIDGRVIS